MSCAILASRSASWFNFAFNFAFRSSASAIMRFSASPRSRISWRLIMSRDSFSSISRDHAACVPSSSSLPSPARMSFASCSAFESKSMETFASRSIAFSAPSSSDARPISRMMRLVLSRVSLYASGVVAAAVRSDLFACAISLRTSCAAFNSSSAADSGIFFLDGEGELRRGDAPPRIGLRFFSVIENPRRERRSWLSRYSRNARVSSSVSSTSSSSSFASNSSVSSLYRSTCSVSSRCDSTVLSHPAWPGISLRPGDSLRGMRPEAAARESRPWRMSSADRRGPGGDVPGDPLWDPTTGEDFRGLAGRSSRLSSPPARLSREYAALASFTRAACAAASSSLSLPGDRTGDLPLMV